jgi:serine/threonine protein kinase
MARKIHILRRLDHPNVIKLEGLVTSRMSSSLYLVFECMEHDLAGLATTPSLKFLESQVYPLNLSFRIPFVLRFKFLLQKMVISGQVLHATVTFWT